MVIKSLITMVFVLAAVLVNCMSADAFTYGGTMTVLKCNPDLTPNDPLHCSIHVVLNEKGGSSPTVFEVFQTTVTVPPGTAALVCVNNGGNTTFSPGLGGVTFIDLQNGTQILNFGNGNLQTDARFLDTISDFNFNYQAFRQYWGLPIDHTLCRSDKWTELMVIAPTLLVAGSIHSRCTDPNNLTTCTVDATINGTCTLTGKVTPTTQSATYTCTNIVVNNNP